MAKYIYIYKDSEPMDMSLIPEEEVKKIMDAWGEWLGSMGDRVVDAGDAFKKESKSVAAAGVGATDGTISGYTIVEAQDFDEALEMAKGNPGVAEGTVVEVYEAFGL